LKIAPGLGLDLDYLERGAKLAQKALGERFTKSKHPTTQQQIVAFVDKSYSTAAMRYTPYYMRLLECSAWRYAQHGVRVNPQTWTFETIPVESRIPRPTLALVGDKVDAVKSELLKSLPAGTVLAKDNTPFNRRGSEMARAKLAQKDEEDHIDAKLDMAADCCITWGDIYAEVVLDHSNAKTVDMPSYIERDLGNGIEYLPVTDAQGNQVTEKIRLADESTNLIFAPQIFFNQSATCLEDSRLVHSHVYRDLEWAMSEWPEHSKEMKAAGMESEAGHFQTRLQNLMLLDTWSGAGSGTYSGMSNFNDEACLVHVIRMNPDPFYPEGRYFMVAAGACTIAGPLPFGKLLLTHWGYNPVPNSIVSHGLVKDIIGLNRHLEQMAHQAAMQRRTLGIPFIMAPERSGGDFAGKTIQMGYGQVYTYRPQGNNKPEVVYPHGTIDSGFVKEMEFFLGEFFERASGVRQGMEGGRIPGVYPAAMLRQIIAQNVGKFIPKMNGQRKFIEALYSDRLTVMTKSPAAQFPMKVPYPGDSTRRLWLEFTAQDMGDNVTYKIEAVSGAATDEATKVQDMLELFKLGVLNPLDRKTQQATLRSMNLEKLIGEMDPNVSKADDENARLAAGDTVTIGPYENDLTHLEVHVDWINSPQFWLMDEERQMATIMHTKDHEDRIKMQQQLAMADPMSQPQFPMPGFNGSAYPAGGAGQVPPAQIPGNGIPGMPQANIKAQQAPSAETEMAAA
jgi:hypothetical protein